MTNNELADLLEVSAKRLREQRSSSGSTIEPETRICVSQKEAARLLDISVDLFATLNIKPTIIGKTCKRYRVSRLYDYLNRQEKEQLQ